MEEEEVPPLVQYGQTPQLENQPAFDPLPAVVAPVGALWASKDRLIANGNKFKIYDRREGNEDRV